MSRAADEVRWSRELTAALDRPVSVSFGRARRNVVVARSRGARLDLRLNERFTAAPPDVRAALVSWLRVGKRARKACATLDAWIDELAKSLGPPAQRPLALRPTGDVHDLEEIASDVIATDLRSDLEPALAGRTTWGRRGTRRAQRSIQLGSWDAERRVVRVHPVLDQRAVPRFFVRYVVFHELLHACDPDGRRERAESGTRSAKREVHHGPEFRRRERQYDEFDRAMKWQADNLGALFRSARSGRPMGPVRTRLREKAQAACSSFDRPPRAAQGFLFPELVRQR